MSEIVTDDPRHRQDKIYDPSSSTRRFRALHTRRPLRGKQPHGDYLSTKSRRAKVGVHDNDISEFFCALGLPLKFLKEEKFTLEDYSTSTTGTRMWLRASPT